VLAGLLRRDIEIAPFSIRQEVDAHLPDRLAPVYRQSLRQRVTGAALTYEEHYRVPNWRFGGAEMILGDSALDLVWITPTGSVYADELKTGLNARLHVDELAAQCEAQYIAGVETFGRRFKGVRGILLTERRCAVFPADKGGKALWSK
jgi:hypothetical protein